MQLIAVNSNDPHLYPDERFERMVERATEDAYAFPYVVDEGQALARAYGATCTFHVFVVDSAHVRHGLALLETLDLDRPPIERKRGDEPDRENAAVDRSVLARGVRDVASPDDQGEPGVPRRPTNPRVTKRSSCLNLRHAIRRRRSATRRAIRWPLGRLPR